MPEMHVCVDCGALTPREDVTDHRCQPCAEKRRQRLAPRMREARRKHDREKRPNRAPAALLRSPAWRRVRLTVLERDGYLCQLRLPGCTVTATTVDHLVSRARGGAALDPNNLRAACTPCNSRKGAR